MKRISLIVLFVILTAPYIAIGQISNYGLKAGIQSAGAYADPPMDGRIVGFSIQGFADWEIDDSFFSTLDLGITQRGFSNSQIRTDETGQRIGKVVANTKLLYATIFPFLNLTTTIKKLQPFVGVGPRLDLLVHKKLGDYNFSVGTLEDLTAHELERVIFGGSVVAGIRNLSISNVNIRVEAKYEVDVTDSFGEDPRNYRNNVLALLVGVNL